MKAGTTSLHGFLDLHPELYMSKAKEINYFNKYYYSRSSDWYEKQFSGSMLSGEATPAYSWIHKYPEVPSRIYQFNPNVKIIYLLRDPIDRIISHLHHDLYRDRIKLEDIPEILFKDSHYINSSKYWYQLSNYLKLFPSDQLCLIQTEDLRNKPYETLNEICKFLKVSSFNPKTPLKNRNTGSRRYLIKHHDFVHDKFPKKLVKYYHWLFYFLNIKIERPKLSNEILEKLRNELNSDVDNLKKQIPNHLDLTLWNNF